MRLRTTRSALAGCTLTLALALAAPAGAGAATAAVDRACYPGDGSTVVTIIGSGFVPDTQVLLEMGGAVVGYASADASGTVRTTMPVPAPPDAGPTKNEKRYDLEIVQGDLRAPVSFSSARVMADFGPSNGRPATLKVRFSAYGFGVATAAGQPMPAVYVHYVDPKGKVRRTVSLGAGTTPCGSIAKTSLRRLFPFNPRRGVWTLQFDTSPTYHRGTGISRFLFDKISLTVS